jgi:hypothetical protein
MLEGNCILWTGARNEDGYGVMRIDGKNQLVHRLTFAAAQGLELKKGAVIMHSCDNPLCINPTHLSFGSHIANVADKMAKNRQAKGENHGLSRLKENEVREILLTHSQKRGFGCKALAKKFGVDKMTIKRVIRRETWTHISVNQEAINPATNRMINYENRRSNNPARG